MSPSRLSAVFGSAIVTFLSLAGVGCQDCDFIYNVNPECNPNTDSDPNNDCTATFVPPIACVTSPCSLLWSCSYNEHIHWQIGGVEISPQEGDAQSVVCGSPPGNVNGNTWEDAHEKCMDYCHADAVAHGATTDNCYASNQGDSSPVTITPRALPRCRPPFV